MLLLANWLMIWQSLGYPPGEKPDVRIVEGATEEARRLGFVATDKRVAVRSVVDEQRPGLPIIWKETLEVPVFETPRQARVFARERWTGAPLVAGYKSAEGLVLWTAASPGATGYERFPYLPQALASLGVEPPFESRRLWAFFDSSYRTRADIEYFAPRWRAAGIAALHVAAWHYWEPDAERDAWLRGVIEAAHRNAIAVYAWIEFPHVSERFWNEHPEWREKTALGQDAHLDWRRLMNLANAECAEAVDKGLSSLAQRFDWDGINLAELYFESLEGAANPARFTPWNADVRAEYKARHRQEPVPGSRSFLEYRAGLARRLQEHWIGRLEALRAQRPYLDMVLTHVDDRFDTTMREKIGADAARLLPFAEERGFTFLVEDPATVWHLGPERYTEIARRYEPLRRQPERLAIDINIVERYQDVYPTKQQTGSELFQLVHLATRAFARVALYFENSILRPDWGLLAASAAHVEALQRDGQRVKVTAPQGVRMRWSGPANVNGAAWAGQADGWLLLPPGTHTVEPAAAEAPVRLIDFNGELREARSGREGLVIRHTTRGRAFAVFNQKPERVSVNGAVVNVRCLAGPSPCSAILN